MDHRDLRAETNILETTDSKLVIFVMVNQISGTTLVCLIMNTYPVIGVPKTLEPVFGAMTRPQWYPPLDQIDQGLPIHKLFRFTMDQFAFLPTNFQNMHGRFSTMTILNAPA